jgi:hypothetical protein
MGSYCAIPGASTPPKLVKFPPTKILEEPSPLVKGHMARILASAVHNDANTPSGSGVSRDCEPLVSEMTSDCCAYEKSDTESKSPVRATRPSDERSMLGKGTDETDMALTFPEWQRVILSSNHSRRKDQKPAAAGLNNEGILIA